MEAPIRRAAEEAVVEVRDAVYRAATEAAIQAVQEAIRRELGVELPEDAIDLEERVTRTEAARRLGTTSQSIMRLEEKGLIHTEKVEGRVYVRLAEVQDALRAGRGVMTRTRMLRAAEQE